jgi:hypothetical protein
MDKSKSSTNLLPSRVFKQLLSCGPSSGDTGGLQASPNPSTLWTAQPVVGWVETMASTTEDMESRKGQSFGDVSIGDLSLSSSSHVPISAPWTVISSPSSSLESQELLPAVSPSSRAFDHVGRHSSIAFDMPKSWNIGFLVQERDPQTLFYVRQIASLAIQIEAMPPRTRKDELRNYQLIQSHVHCAFRHILSAYKNGEERRVVLIKLCEDTVIKLEKLLQAATLCERTGSQGSPFRGTPPVTPSLSSPTSPETKKDLSKFMTVWLRANWTNPYPDEEVTAQLAGECGTTATVVSNWLINARTRKWRPSIVKATDLNRSAAMLLADSLAIFDGKLTQSSMNEDDEEMDTDDDAPPAKRIKK